MQIVGPQSQVVLPCSAITAYVPQVPVIFSGTLKDNIIFNLPYDNDAFEQTIMACALDADISSFVAGVDTSVSSLVLSVGQQARLCLGRCVYACLVRGDQDCVALLDDPLAALDVRVAKHVLNEVILGVLKSSTRVLVSNDHKVCVLCHQLRCAL